MENRLLDAYTAVLTSPLHLKDNWTPLGAYVGRLKKLANEVRTIEGKDRKLKALEALSPKYQSDVKHKFTDSKAGIPPFALNNVHHSLGQIASLAVRSKLDVLDVLSYRDGLIDVSQKMGTDGVAITDWLSAFIDAHLDAPKDPYIIDLNIGPSTYNVANMLLRAGAGADFVAYLLSQPIMKEYTALERILKGKIGGDEFISAANLIRQKYLKETSSTLVDTIDRTKLLTTNTLQKVLRGRGAVALVGKEGASVSWHAAQVAILDWFKEVNRVAFQFNDAVQASQIDTKRFGSNLTQALAFTNRLERVLNDGTVVNFDKLVSESFLGTFLENSVELARKMFRQLTISSTPVFNGILDVLLAHHKLSEGRGLSYKNYGKVINKLANTLHSTLVSSYFTSPIGLGINNDIMKSMFYGKNSLANVIYDIKVRKSRFKHLVDNPLIQLLDPVFSDDPGRPNHLSILSYGKLDKWSKDSLTRAWQEMFTDNSSESEAVRRLAVNLMVYSFVTSGFKMGLNSFYQYLPTDALTYVPEHLKKLNENQAVSYNEFVKAIRDHMNDERGGLERVYDSILREFYRNNWNDDLIVPYIGEPMQANEKNYMPRYEPNNKTTYPSVFSPVKEARRLYYGVNFAGTPLFMPYVKYKHSRSGLVLLAEFVGVRFVGPKQQPIPVYKTIAKKGYFTPSVRIYEFGLEDTSFDFNKLPVEISYENEPKISNLPGYADFYHVPTNERIPNLSSEKSKKNYDELFEEAEVVGETKSEPTVEQKAIGAPSKTPEFDKLPGPSIVPTKTYAGIGSRSTPLEVQKIMTELADELAEKGIYFKLPDRARFCTLGVVD